MLKDVATIHTFVMDLLFLEFLKLGILQVGFERSPAVHCNRMPFNMYPEVKPIWPVQYLGPHFTHAAGVDPCYEELYVSCVLESIILILDFWDIQYLKSSYQGDLTQ